MSADDFMSPELREFQSRPRGLRGPRKPPLVVVHSADIPLKAERPVYVLHGGVIRSKTDGDPHYVGALALIRLYRIDRSDTLRYPDDPVARQLWRDPPNAVHLYPRYDGNYTLPTP